MLQEVGLGSLSDSEKNSLLKHIYDTLEMRVGMRLADQMSNQQLDEFEKYYESKDDAGAFKWLETNFPNYKDIVQEEYDKLKAEVTQSAPQILSSSQAQVQQAAQPASGAAQTNPVPPAQSNPSVPPTSPIVDPASPPQAPSSPPATFPSEQPPAGPGSVPPVG